MQRLTTAVFALLLAVTAPSAPAATRVVVATAQVVDFPLVVEALGTARANESIEVRPQISETITAIRFEEGQDVAAGDVLVELDDTELTAAVAQARAALAETESQYTRARDLFSSKAVSASEMERLTAQREAAQAVLRAAQARLSDAVVTAPFAGRVGLRRVSPGSLVTPQTIITTLDDTDPIKLDFNVPETFIARLAAGQVVEAHSVAWPDQPFHGSVTSVDTRVDPVTRTVIVRAVIDNDEGRLRPGMFLTVRLLKEEVRALVIPEQAIVPEQSRQYVYLLDDAGSVSKRQVTTGRRLPGRIEVLEGLTVGDRVVAEGTQKVRPGEPVEVVGEIEVGS